MVAGDMIVLGGSQNDGSYVLTVIYINFQIGTGLIFEGATTPAEVSGRCQ